MNSLRDSFLTLTSEQQTISMKGHIVNILGSVGHIVTITLLNSVVW